MADLLICWCGNWQSKTGKVEPRGKKMLPMLILLHMLLVAITMGNNLPELNCDTFCEAPCTPKVWQSNVGCSPGNPLWYIQDILQIPMHSSSKDIPTPDNPQRFPRHPPTQPVDDKISYLNGCRSVEKVLRHNPALGKAAQRFAGNLYLSMLWSLFWRKLGWKW